MAENDALPIDGGLLEINQQTQASAGGAKIIEALSVVIVGETLDAFQFDNEHVFD